MKFYEEKAKQLPVVGDYDVVVCGGGPAGIGAAWGAGKHGAKVLLLENSNRLGGMAIPGMMSHWVGTCGSNVYREIIDRCYKNLWPNEKPVWWNFINHEKQKLVMLDILEEVGVTVQFHTFVAGVSVENGTVSGVITESKSGREFIAAKTVIDCTGDGDAAALAGVPFQKGREEDGLMQPATLMFKIAGVDVEKAVYPPSFETLVQTPKGELQALARKILPGDAGHVLLYPGTIPGTAVVNMTNITGVDGTNVRDLTRAEITCARQIPAIMNFLREYVPGYEKSYVISCADYVGIRETRHFECLYRMTPEDIVDARVFEDWIATDLAFNFDIHNVEGAGLDKHGEQAKFTAKGNYTVPLRSCVPSKIDGLLLAGRCICGTHKAHSNYRAMPICLAVGQGCGTVAAFALKQGVAPRNVKIADVQSALLSDGMTCPPGKNE